MVRGSMFHVTPPAGTRARAPAIRPLIPFYIRPGNNLIPGFE
jgi:hypothetical protein